MAKKLISFNFNGDFVPELESLTRSYPLSEVSTKYCITAPSRMKEYSTDTYLAEALANYIGSINTMHLFVGKTARNQFVAEYRKSGKDETQICIGEIKDKKFEFKAGNYSEAGLLTNYEEGHKGTVFAMAMLPEIAKDSEARSFIDVLMNYPVEDENYSKAMCGLFNHIYYRLKDEKSTSPVLYEQEPKKLTQAEIEAVKISKVFCGEAKVFTESAAPTGEDFGEEDESVIRASSDLLNMYQLNPERVLTEEESKRIPEMGDWYVPSELSMKLARRISASRGLVTSGRSRKPILNVLLYGTSDTGKTTDCKATARMLGLPYYTHTCGPDDDKLDTIGGLIPNTRKGKSKDPDEACMELGIPTFSDVENDFKVSFTRLFGREPGKLDSESDAYEEITRRLLENKTDDDNDFVYVESEIIQAIKHGGLCEIQEANIIKRSSVLESINALLAGDGNESFIKLPTGEIVRRHPDCVIVFTIYREYDGCNDLQEAVYSRINLIKHVPEPTEDEMFARAKAQTDFNNITLLRKMAKTVAEIHQYCREKDITGGVCGPRELIDWAQDAILESEERGEDKVTEKSVIAAALETVLEKVAQNEDDIEDVIAGVFNKHFSPSAVNAMRGKK